jgi:FHA domain
MSDLLVLGLKLLFLALLWMFVLFAINVIRTDLFGRKVEASAIGTLDAAGAVPPPAASPKPRGRAGRRLPTTLRLTAGAIAGASLPLGDMVLIGRGPDATIDLHDQYMSTRHAAITRTGSGFVIEDFGSTNGTFVNERRITTPTPITPSDTIRIGRTTMILDA